MKKYILLTFLFAFILLSFARVVFGYNLENIDYQPLPDKLEKVQIQQQKIFETHELIFLYWGKIDEANSYEIRYRPALNNTKSDFDYGCSLETVYSIENLDPYTEYELQVRAVINDSCSESRLNGPWSDLIIKRTYLGRVSGGSAISVGDSIYLFWDKLDDALAYEVDYRKSSDNWGLKENWSHACVRGTSHKINNLDENTDYYVYIRGVESSICRDPDLYAVWSNRINVTTGSSQDVDNVYRLRGRANRYNAIHLFWKDVNGAASYNIEYKKSQDSEWASKCVAYSTDLIGGLTSPNVYDFRLSAFTGKDCKDNSVLVGAIEVPLPLGRVSGLVLTITSQESLKLDWREVARAGAYSIVYWEDFSKYARDEREENIIERICANDEFIVLDELRPNTEYTLSVKAMTSENCEESKTDSYWSKEITSSTHARNVIEE